MEYMGLLQGDWIFLGVLLIVLVVGAILGFGKVLGWFVLNKFVRIIIAVFVCYTFGGMILDIPAISQLLIDLRANWADISFLNTIHLEVIIYYIILFALTMLIVLLLSKIIRGVSETKALPVKILNKIGGAILFGAFALAIMLLIFQIIVWIGGDTAINFHDKLYESADLILLPLFENNPLLRLVNLIV